MMLTRHCFVLVAACGLLLCNSVAAAQPASISGNAFNPSIGLILESGYSDMSGDYPAITQPGFLTGGEAAEPAGEGFALGEAELYLSANVDTLFYAQANIAFHEGEADVEEAYFRTLGLPNGVVLQAGQFLSGVGYLNARHAHSWDFVDLPLAYSTLMGGQYKDPGVQLTWLAPTPIFFTVRC